MAQRQGEGPEVTCPACGEREDVRPIGESDTYSCFVCGREFYCDEGEENNGRSA